MSDTLIGADLPLENAQLRPGGALCSGLERFVPEILSRTIPAWEGESLDGVSVIRATRVGVWRLRLLATAVLLSDQRVCPLLVEVEASPEGDAVVGYVIQIGEPGEGPLGISGPACGSGAAARMLRRLPGREEFGRVGWVFTATGASSAMPSRERSS